MSKYLLSNAEAEFERAPFTDNLGSKWAVWRALMFREFQTGFANLGFGLFWLLLEPTLHAVFFSVIFGVMRGDLVNGIPTPLFVMSGIVLLLPFMRLSTHIANIVPLNKALYKFRQVRIMDTILVSTVFEGILLVFTYLVLMGGLLWMGYSIRSLPGLMTFAAILALFILALGLGCTIAVLAYFAKDWRQILGWILRPVYFLSGIFFMVQDLPHEFRHLILYNPIVHVTEIVRQDMFPNAGQYYGDLFYLWSCAGLGGGFGLVLVFIYRHRLPLEGE